MWRPPPEIRHTAGDGAHQGFRSLVGGAGPKRHAYPPSIAGVVIRCLRHLEQTLAPPHANHAHSVFVQTIYDTERRVDELPELRNTEFGHDTTALWEVGKPLNA